MKTQGIDRVAILVRDLDQAKSFFAGVLGIELKECVDARLAAGGVRIAMSFDEHLELIAPMRPVSDAYPEVTRQMAAALDGAGSDSLLFGLSFRVVDADRAAEQAAQEGLNITRRFDQAAIPELGVRNLREMFLDPRQCGGLNIGLVSFEQVDPPS